MSFSARPKGAIRLAHPVASAAGFGASAPAQPGPVRSNVKSVDHARREDRRLAGYKAKKTAANILIKQGDKLERLGVRVSHCRYVSRAEQVTLDRQGETARFDGLKSCNSVWCCAICSARISAGRRDELNALLAAARAEGLAAVMLTLTASHKRGMILSAWLAAFKDAKRTLRQRREWRALKGAFVGSVTATEVTHSEANGFHPHLHEILLFNGSEAEALAAVEGLRAAWLASLTGQGLSGNEHAFQVQPATAAGEYVAKFGAAEELTLDQAKRGRKGSRTPWQILDDAGDAENPKAKRDGAIWTEFAAAFIGRRQLVWSPGLKARFGIDEIEDAEIPEGETAEPVEVLRAWLGKSDEWRRARRRSVALLSAAERGTCLDAAEHGPADSERWRAKASGPVIEPE